MRAVAILLAGLCCAMGAPISTPPMVNGMTDWDAMYKAPVIPPFTCKPLTPSASKPTDVNKLRFADIDVVMSLGDSITAAFAANEVLKVDGLLEYRGVSWACGGDEKHSGHDVYSLANFIRKVTGKLPKGASHGTELPVDASKKDGKRPYHGPAFIEHFNVAQSSATVQDMPDEVDFLIQRMKDDKSVNMDEDWKMLNIMIGANNGCGACRGRPTDTADAYYQSLNATIAKAQAGIPRLFINLLNMFNTSGVYDQQLTSKYCLWVQQKFHECGCMKSTEPDRKMMDIAIQSYNKQMETLAAEWTARGLKDFKIVSQPALRDMKVPSREYLSGLDCFHPNQYAHGAFAIGLWNNLMQAPGQKSTSLVPETVTISCPTDDQYLQ